MFKRKIYDKILDWKKTKNGDTALLIEGARRIGKSTIVEQFAKNEYKSYIIIDFSIAKKEIIELFDDMSDLDYFFLRLKLLTATSLYERESLIVFDEVQLCPKARQAIKSLVKDHRYDYIETGSLISIKKNVYNILIPSEETKISMYPMDYEEFLWAVDGDDSVQLLRDVYRLGKPLGEATNRVLMRKFRLYMLIGGMPQAVDTYIRKNDFKAVDEVKRDILSLYEDDFKKIDPTGRLGLMFNAIPSQLNKNKTNYKIQSVIGSYQESEEKLLSLMGELNDSKVVNIAYHANDPRVDINATKDLYKYKIYMGDTGLFVTMLFKDKYFTENYIYEKLLANKLPINLGYLYENAVAQTIVANGHNLFYYTFYNETQKRNYEVDFIYTKQNKICPLEVKSSDYRKHSSIDKFYDKFSERILHRYIIHTKDLSHDKDIICLPIYLLQYIL